MTDDIELIERTKSALEHFGDCPWLPDLTGDLVKIGWRALYQEAGLSPSNYGTSRAITKSVRLHRNVLGHSSTSSAVEVLDERLAAYYAGAGIEFYTAREIVDANLLSCVGEALNLISRIPTLRATVDALVRSLHLIKPDNDDYDVSFSEPHIPFSIFVSVPQQQSYTTDLRVAEAIVHEAMHLQLTLVESILPLVKAIDGRYFSPWRREYRDAQGILHGLYVSCVIEQFLGTLQSLRHHRRDVIRYIAERRSEIHKQVDIVSPFQTSVDLTESGASFTRRIMVSLDRSNEIRSVADYYL
jgi:hypothetical protein